ncbi:hypothetical protein CsatA_030922 [Cannabis sativa]
MGTLGRAIYTIGFWITETGQPIDRLVSRCRTLMNVFDKAQGSIEAFVAPSAPIIGWEESRLFGICELGRS